MRCLFSRPSSKALNLVGVLIFALILIWGGREPWERVLTGVPHYVLATFLTTGAWTLLGAARWCTLGEAVADGAVCSRRRFYACHVVATAFGQIASPLIGSLGGRPALLSLSAGWSFKRALLSSLLDKAFDLLLIGVLLGPALLILARVLSPEQGLAAMGVAIIIGFVGLWLTYKHGKPAMWLARVWEWLLRLPLVGRRLAGPVYRLSQLVLPNSHTTGRAYLLTLLMYGLLMLRLVCVAEALRLEIPWLWLVVGLPIAQLSLLLSLIPGALGTFELGWYGVLALAGVESETILAFLIGRRLYTTVFIPIWALIGVILDRKPLAVCWRRARTTEPRACSG
jgi:uncharacterized protein (TIRG00374 family)